MYIQHSNGFSQVNILQPPSKPAPKPALKPAPLTPPVTPATVNSVITAGKNVVNSLPISPAAKNKIKGTLKEAYNYWSTNGLWGGLKKAYDGFTH